jgi:hypothetical protein
MAFGLITTLASNQAGKNTPAVPCNPGNGVTPSARSGTSDRNGADGKAVHGPAYNPQPTVG